MQNNQFKITSLSLLFLFGASINSFCQAFLRDIEVADSLFEEKKFTESLEIYKAIHETGEYASPAMLLKMAYINEGLGDDSGALYYLNTYYLQTINDKVFVKMEEIADQNNLKGYEYADQDWFFNIYYKYYYHLIIALSTVAVFMFLMVLYQKIKQGKKAYSSGFGLLIVVALLFMIVNFGTEYKQGILTKNNSYIMGAPSASADVLDISKAGHRVKILGQEDIWVKILWDDHIGYIKNTYIKQLFF